MGYGEYSGGGSVEWRTEHGNHHHSHASSHGASGKDNDPPKGSNGRFHVIVNGVQVANIDLDTGHVVIVWGRHIDEVRPDKRNVPMPPIDEYPQAR